MKRSTVTLCGRCMKEKCLCAPLTIKTVAEKPHPVGPIVTSPIVLPDILDCAVYGQAIKRCE